MNKLSYKYKIIIVIVLFVLFAVGMFTYGYGILEGKNQSLADVAMQQQSEYEMLKREQQSFEQGKKDLAILEKKILPPQELFSKDTKVVKEIKIMEDIANSHGVKFSLAIAGNSKTAVKAAGTISEVFVIPYTATIEGSFENIIKYQQAAEHLPFAMHANSFNISALESGATRAVLNSEFYLRK